MQDVKELIFKPIEEKWTQVNTNADESARTLADTLLELGIIIDDNTQFCRIIRYYDEYQKTITYRAYTQGKITITIHNNKYE